MAFIRMANKTSFSNARKYYPLLFKQNYAIMLDKRRTILRRFDQTQPELLPFNSL